MCAYVFFHFCICDTETWKVYVLVFSPSPSMQNCNYLPFHLLIGEWFGWGTLEWRQYDSEWAEDDWAGPRMGVHAKGDHKAEEHSRRSPWAAVQLRGLYDALYVSFCFVFHCHFWLKVQSLFWFLVFFFDWKCFDFFEKVLGFSDWWLCFFLSFTLRIEFCTSWLVQIEMYFFWLPANLVFYMLCFLNCKDRTIYNMCTQKPPHDYSQQLYDKYQESFVEYINSTVRMIYC